MVADSRKIFEVVCHLLHIVHTMGGDFSIENPPTSLAWAEPCVNALLDSVSHVRVLTSACTYGQNRYKHWLFISSLASLGSIATQCPHGDGWHPRWK